MRISLCHEKQIFSKNRIMMKLEDSRQLQFYENHFHKTGFDTFECSEYLKNIEMLYVEFI